MLEFDLPVIVRDPTALTSERVDLREGGDQDQDQDQDQDDHEDNGGDLLGLQCHLQPQSLK